MINDDRIRAATLGDLEALAAMRGTHAGSHAHWRGRIAGYLSGTHHPQQALAERVIFVAEADGRFTGRIAGHLTRRFDCQGNCNGWTSYLNAAGRVWPAPCSGS